MLCWCNSAQHIHCPPPPPSRIFPQLLTGSRILHPLLSHIVIQPVIHGPCTSERHHVGLCLALGDSKTSSRHMSVISNLGSAPTFCIASCLNIHQFSRHRRLGVPALKMLLESLGVWHLGLHR